MLLFLVAAVAGLGLWNLASASLATHGKLWLTQLSWLGAGCLAAMLLAALDYRWLLRAAWPLYALAIAMLLVVALHGRTVMGARRWLMLGPLRVQPSEFAKLAVIVALARFFHLDASDEGYGLTELWQPALLLLLPVALVVAQPDLGTALCTAAVGLSMVLFAKVRWRALALMAAGGAGGATAGWLWVFKPYQKKRVLTFLNPAGDALGAGYHAMQSMIAVGSGQWSGKGWGHGTQNLLSFLPEQHTDFIFSVWAEEHGFLGSALVVLLYLLLVLSCLQVAAQARDRFGAYLAVGVAAMFFWHAFINIGMVIGLLPVVGVTLPLMSFGGSSAIAFLMGVGVACSVSMRRFAY